MPKPPLGARYLRLCPTAANAATRWRCRSSPFAAAPLSVGAWLRRLSPTALGARYLRRPAPPWLPALGGELLLGVAGAAATAGRPARWRGLLLHQAIG